MLDDKNYPDYLKEITNLHIAYCKALNADFNDAATIFNEIILANPNSDNATTALILLRYFKDLEKHQPIFSTYTNYSKARNSIPTTFIQKDIRNLRKL